jgi:hypothetical protein
VRGANEPASGEFWKAEHVQARQNAARSALRHRLAHPDGQTLGDLLEVVRLIGIAAHDCAMRELYRRLGILPDAAG